MKSVFWVHLTGAADFWKASSPDRRASSTLPTDDTRMAMMMLTQFHPQPAKQPAVEAREVLGSFRSR